MSPPANRVQVAAGSKAVAAPAAGQASAFSGQSARSLTGRRRTARRRPRPGPGRTARSRRRAGRRGACGSRRGPRRAVAASVASDRAGSASGGPLDAERGEDRVRLAGHELERVVAVARPGEDRLRPRVRLEPVAVPELGDRDDRHVGERTPAVGRRRRLGRRRSGGAADGRDIGGGLASAPVRAGGRAGRAGDRPTADGAGRAPEPEPTAGDRHDEGDREEAEDDELTAGRALHRGRSPDSKRERPVRAGGRGVGKCVDGGPDRIRTGDLQRDRLACWAATPRVQLRRGRSIAGGPGACPVGHAVGRARSECPTAPAYTRRPWPSSTSAATPSPSPRPRCAGRWPRPRSATTSSATTRRSTRSRSGPPSCSARRPACSSPSGTMGNLVAQLAHLAARPGDHRRPRAPHRHRRGGRPRGHRRDEHPGARATARRHDRSGRHRGGVPRPDRPPRADHGPDHHREHPRPLDGPAADRRRIPREVAAIAHAHGVPLHIDGARFWNAVVAARASRPATWPGPADTVTFCLSQGPRLPGRVGRRRRRATSSGGRVAAGSCVGGGMRQAGILAAAGLVALSDGPDGMIDRLAEDHANARRLAEALSGSTGSRRPAAPPSRTPGPWIPAGSGRTSSSSRWSGTGPRSSTALRARNVLMVEYPHGQVRAVTHYGVTADDIDTTIVATREALAETRRTGRRRGRNGLTGPIAGPAHVDAPACTEDPPDRLDAARPRRARAGARPGPARRPVLRSRRGAVPPARPREPGPRRLGSASTPTTTGWATASRDAVLARAGRRARHLAAIEALDPAGLSAEARFERDLEIHNVRRDHLRHRRPADLGAPVDRPRRRRRRLFLLFARDHAPLDERLDAIAGRLEATPAFLDASRTPGGRAPGPACGRRSRSRPPARSRPSSTRSWPPARASLARPSCAVSGRAADRARRAVDRLSDMARGHPGRWDGRVGARPRAIRRAGRPSGVRRPRRRRHPRRSAGTTSSSEPGRPGRCGSRDRSRASTSQTVIDRIKSDHPADVRSCARRLP